MAETPESVAKGRRLPSGQNEPAPNPGYLSRYRKRLDELVTRRQKVEQIWRQCYDVIAPTRGAGIALKDSASPDASLGYALERLSAIYDTTAVEATRILSSALASGLTPSNVIWAILDLSDRPEAEIEEDEKAWLEQVSRFLWRNIHNASFDADNVEAMIDIVIAGMSSLYIEEDLEEGGFSFELWPLGECYFSSTRKDGMVDTCYRVYHPNAGSLVAEYGADGVSERVRALAERSPDTLVKCCRAIEPRPNAAPGLAPPNRRPWASVTFEYDTGKVLRESGYYEFPLVVGRWSRIPGSAYATGVALDALPSIRTANEIKKLTLDNADIAIAGMWIATDDGVLNPRSIEVGARKVVVANSVDSMKELRSAADFDVSAIVLEDERKAIRRAMMTEELQPVDKPNMTAFEVHVQVEKVRQILGPMYGRMQVEYVQRIVERCFAIASRAGVLPPPPETLRDANLRVRFVSPIARAQRGVEVNAMNQYEADLGATAGLRPEVLDLYNWDEAKRRKAELLGVPLDLLNDDDEVDEIRGEREQQIAAAQQQQTAAALAPEVLKQTGQAMQQ